MISLLSFFLILLVSVDLRFSGGKADIDRVAPRLPIL
jgi:hypothetical protein